MDSLPKEMLESIFSNLDTRDVLRCNLVCRRWRNTLETDKIWRRLCKNDYGIDCRVKLGTPVVEPRFQMPQNYSDLTEICSCRMRYMMEIHVMNNWRLGNFVKKELFEREDLDFYSHDDKFIVATTQKPNYSIRIWDVTNDFLDVTPKQCELEFDLLYTKTIGDFFFYVQGSVLQTYKIGKSLLEFERRFLVTKDGSASTELPKIFESNGKFFIAVFYDKYLHRQLINVWDYTKGELFYSLAIDSFDILSDVNIISNRMFVLTSCLEYDEYNLRWYDLKNRTLEVLALSFPHCQKPVVTDKYVITFDKKTPFAFVTDNRNGQVLSSVNLGVKHDCYFVEMPYIFALKRGKSSMVTIFNAEHMRVDHRSDFSRTVASVTLIKFNLMLVTFQPLFTELWDIHTLNKLCTLSYGSFRIVKGCSRYRQIAYKAKKNKKEYYMLHFW